MILLKYESENNNNYVNNMNNRINQCYFTNDNI